MMNGKKKLIADRWDVMEGLIEGKSVLDLGCVDHEAENEVNSHWLHRKVKNVASDVLGIDYQEEDVKQLKDKGYHVQVGNVECLDLGRTFEVVTAGNIIEHVSNPGLFLDSVNRHMNSDSLFLLTTDNCFGLRSLKAVTLKDGIRPNDEHVATYEKEVLSQLFDRHGFEIIDYYYYNGPYANPWKQKLINFLCKIRKSFAWQMLVIAKRK